MKIFFLLSVFISELCFAQNKAIPTPEDIASKLATPQISRSMGQGFVPRGVKDTDAKPEEAPSINLNINFEFDSANLTSEGKVLVGNLARALKDPRLIGQKFILEGHTDAKGADLYNMTLSGKRAATVKNELVESYGLDKLLLQVVGYGKSKLLDQTNPENPINRRVTVVNVGI